MNNSPTHTRYADWRAYALGLFAVLVFGATLPVTRLALDDFSPGLLTFLRADIATFLAMAALLLFKKPLRHGREILIFVAGLLLIHGFPGFMAVAMQTVPASHGGIILGFLPLSTAVIASIVAGERPSLRFWSLTLAGFLLVTFFVLFKDGGTTSLKVSAGDMWLILAGISASTGYVIFGKLSRDTPGWEIIARALLLNVPITFLGTWFFYDMGKVAPSTTGILSLLYLGMFSMFLGFCAWNMALAIGGISRIGQLQLLQIFATLFVSAVLLAEKISLTTLISACAITALIAASRRG